MGDVGNSWGHASVEVIPGAQQVLRPIVSQKREHLGDTRGAQAVDICAVLVQQKAVLFHPAHGLEKVTVILCMYTPLDSRLRPPPYTHATEIEIRWGFSV